MAIVIEKIINNERNEKLKKNYNLKKLEKFKIKKKCHVPLIVEEV